MQDIGPKVRTRDWLKKTRTKAREWSIDLMSRKFPTTVLTADIVLPENVLKRITRNTRIRSPQDIVELVKPRWFLAEEYGDELLACIREVDEERAAEQASRRTATNRTEESRQRDKGPSRLQRVHPIPVPRPVTATPQNKSPVRFPLVGSSTFNQAVPMLLQMPQAAHASSLNRFQSKYFYKNFKYSWYGTEQISRWCYSIRTKFRHLRVHKPHPTLSTPPTAASLYAGTAICNICGPNGTRPTKAPRLSRAGF